MKLVAGKPFWTQVNKIPKQYPYLTEDTKCDVVIIGAGITGAICSYYFNEAGIDTVLLDRDIIGYQSTSASTSLLQYEIDFMLQDLKEMIGIDKALTAFRLCHQAVYDLENILDQQGEACGFEFRDCLYYSSSLSDETRLKKEFMLRKENGFKVEYLDKQDAAGKFSFPIEAGIYSTAGAAEVDPYRLSHLLISKAVQKGLRVFENTEVTEILPQVQGAIIKTAHNKTVSTRKVIIATGFEAKNLVSQKFVTLSRSFTVVTKPVEVFNGWFGRCLIRDTKDNYTYLRTTNDNRIMIGGEDCDIGGVNSNMSNLAGDAPVAEEKYRILMNKLAAMFPGIENIEPEYAFNGIFGNTKDGLPYIGEYQKMPNCYFCLGYGSNGILYAIFGAQMLRDLYLGKRWPELEMFSFNR